MTRIQTRLLLHTLAFVAGCQLGIIFLLSVILPGATGWVKAVANTMMLIVTAGPLLWWRFSHRQAEAEAKAAPESGETALLLRHARNAIIGGLLCVGVLALAATVVLRAAAGQRGAKAELVYKTAQQRMLGQHLAVAAAMRTLDPSPTQQRAFEAALEEYEAAAGVLRDRLGSSEADLSRDPEIAPRWSEALAAIQRVLAVGRTIGEGFDQGRTNRAALDELLAANSAAVERLDAANKTIAANDASGAAAMRLMGAGLGVLLVSALMLVWLLGFGPVVQQAKQAVEALGRSEALLRAIIECTSDGIIAGDGAGNIRVANPAVERMLGYGPGELVGQPVTTIIPKHLGDARLGSLEQLLVAGGEPRFSGKLVEVTALRREKTGEGEVPVELSLGMTKHAQEILFVASLRDITERKAAELRIRRLASAVEAADGAIMLTDIEGNIVLVNAAFSRITGYTPDEAIGQTPRLLKSGQHASEFYRQLWATIEAGKTWNGRLVNRRKDGVLYYSSASISPVLNDDGGVVGYVSMQRDITAEMEREQALEAAARTDKLTGLANRALLYDRLQQAVLRAKRNKGYRFAVLFLDLDRFKLINDSLGHAVGDLLLQEIAARLRRTVRSGDSISREAGEHTTARLGGDEFVVFLDGIRSPDDALIVADRLLEVLAQPFRLGEHEVFSTVSIGIVNSDTPADSAEEVLRNADIAMYEAKLAGKGRCVRFDESMHQRIQDRLALETDLRKALDAGQLFLMYQPIVSLDTHEIESVEALIRWKHPQRGLILPGEFIPIAEDTGLIVPIGEWVLRESCRQFAAWRQSRGDAAPRGISVNLSRNQLMQTDLPVTIRRILEETGVPPSCLYLELTESAVMRDVESAARVLHAIKEIGVKLSLDDFGTGHSSLACLHHFPIDVLKIDRSFIANIDLGRGSTALIHAAIQLAQNLQISVVAEGIETTEQIAALRAMECEFGQGHLFSKPLIPEQVAELSCQEGVFPGQSTSEPGKDRLGMERPLEPIAGPPT